MKTLHEFGFNVYSEAGEGEPKTMQINKGVPVGCILEDAECWIANALISARNISDMVEEKHPVIAMLEIANALVISARGSLGENGGRCAA